MTSRDVNLPQCPIPGPSDNTGFLHISKIDDASLKFTITWYHLMSSMLVGQAQGLWLSPGCLILGQGMSLYFAFNWNSCTLILDLAHQRVLPKIDLEPLAEVWMFEGYSCKWFPLSFKMLLIPRVSTCLCQMGWLDYSGMPPHRWFCFFIGSSQVSSHFVCWIHFPDHFVMSPRVSFRFFVCFPALLSFVSQHLSPRHTPHSLVNHLVRLRGFPFICLPGSPLFVKVCLLCLVILVVSS